MSLRPRTCCCCCCCCHDEPVRQPPTWGTVVPKRWAIPPDSHSPGTHLWCQSNHRSNAGVLLPISGRATVMFGCLVHGRSDGGGYRDLYPPKSAKVNFLWGKNDVRTAIQQFYPPPKLLYPPKQISGYAPGLVPITTMWTVSRWTSAVTHLRAELTGDG